MMNLVSPFYQNVLINPAKCAIHWGDTQITYLELWNQSSLILNFITEVANIKKGQTVGILLKNRPHYVATIFAILRAGAIVVPINSFLKADEIIHIAKDANIQLVITEIEFDSLLPKIAAAIPQLKFFHIEQINTLKKTNFDKLQPYDNNNISPEDLAFLYYTSGTTGNPKGVMITHRNLLSNVQSCSVVLSTVNSDRFILLLPMFHSFMICVCIFLPLLQGATIVLVKSIHPLKNIFHEISKCGDGVLAAIPQFFRTMVDSDLPGDLPLKLCISGAAPLPVQVLKEFQKKFKVPLLEGYGLSEASPVVSINPVKGPWKEGSVGIPIPGVSVCIQNDSGDILKPKEIGEICVKGNNVMKGYWNQQQSTAQAFRNGWLLTGDIGYIDEDGYIFITDRKKDMILVNGINVYPREIEEVLYRYPGVHEAAVVGAKDIRKGEQPIAFISVLPGVKLEKRKVGTFLRSYLADYKVPKKIIVLDALPRNANGKILKPVLKQMLNNQDYTIQDQAD